MQRLDLHDRVGGGFGQCGSLHRLEPAGFTHLRIARTQVTHHQRRRHRVVALAPHRRAYRDHLVDDGFCRVGAARHDGRDVIDLDTTGHCYSF